MATRSTSGSPNFYYAVRNSERHCEIRTLSGLSPGRGQPRGRERVSAGFLPGVDLADSLQVSQIAITERKQAADVSPRALGLSVLT